MEIFIYAALFYVALILGFISLIVMLFNRLGKSNRKITDKLESLESKTKEIEE